MGSSPYIAGTQPSSPAHSPTVVTSNAIFHPRMPFVVGILLMIILLFGAIRFRLRNMPLERDEGEYAYSGQLLLQGIPPYKLAYNLKLPGIYVAYASMLAVLGQTSAGIHLGLLLLNAVSSILIFLLASHLFGRLAGLVSAATYSLLSASTSVMGFEAHATNFVVLPALLAILCLLHGLRSHQRWLFLACGFLCGIAFLMKQHGVFFALFCFAYLIRAAWKEKRSVSRLSIDALLLASGFLLPYAITCLLLYQAGVFRQFWLWTVDYAGEYSKMGLRRGVHAFLENFRAILRANAIIWAIAFLGLTAGAWNRRARNHLFFTATFLLFSFLALCPGAYFRPHYFILLLPAAALLTGLAVSSASETLGKHGSRQLALVPAVIFLAAFGWSVLLQRTFYFSLDPSAAMNLTYGSNPFVAAMQTADYIRQNSFEKARIAVLGSEPEIYFYARRQSATGYLYMYSLIVRQKYTERMQKEFIDEVEANRPEYLVYVDVADSWGEGRDSAPQASEFLAWVRKYAHEHYVVDGVAKLDEPNVYLKGESARSYRPSSGTQAIYVLKRIP
jgi:hypothetical protein